MKKLIVYMLILSLVCACGAGCTPKGPEFDPERLECPGLPWGISPEEALKALGKTGAESIRDEEDRDEDEDYWTRYVYVPDVTLYGQKAGLVGLLFWDYTKTGTEYDLVQVVICYPDGYDGTPAADLQALKVELERYYGASTEELYLDREHRKALEPTAEHPADFFRWESEWNGWTSMSQEQQEATKWFFDGTENTITTWEEYLQKMEDAPSFSIDLTPVANLTVFRLGHGLTQEQRDMGATDLRITLNATGYFHSQYVADQRVQQKAEAE